MSSDVTSAYIKKLNHPLKEIRERSLQVLIAKIRLGWEFEDELSCTRELLEALLTWFESYRPSLQKEALELLLLTIKTKAGTYIAKELGIQTLISNLNKFKIKIDSGAMEIFEDVIETLKFLNTVDSEVNCIPPLRLHSESSESNYQVSDFYNLALTKDSSKDTSISNVDIQLHSQNDSIFDGINLLLFPWVELNPSDLKTMLLIEDSLKVLKSTRRCCRFIRNVFLRDFPPEIFLNRPVIVKTLLGIADGKISGNSEEALKVLMSITECLHMRYIKLFSLDLVSKPYRVQQDHKDSDDNVNIELAQFADGNFDIPENNALDALRQLPAPIFALETSFTVLTIMARSVLYVDTDNHNDGLNMRDLNLCISLTESLIKLLLDCVNKNFWCMEHSSKTHRDIAHKASVVMRMMGDLLTKYRKSFLIDTNLIHYRSAYLRLANCGELLLSWSKKSPLPPSSLVVAMQVAQVDPAIELLYEGLSERIASVLLAIKSQVDQDYKNKLRELKKLFFSMDNAVNFFKINKHSTISKDILIVLKNALPVLHLNMNEKLLNDATVAILKKFKNMDMLDSDWDLLRNISLSLMAHSLSRVQLYFYRMLSDMIQSVLLNDNSNETENEKSLSLICDVGILTEICCHGLASTNKEVESCASEVILYLLRGRMVLSDSCWWRLLASLLPVLPLLHVYAAHDTELGLAICKSLEEEIVSVMGVSISERSAGLVRLLLNRCPSVSLDAAHQLCQIMDDSKYLPPRETLRPDIILNAMRGIEPQDFNIDQTSSPSKNTQTSGLIQILDVLKQDLVLDTDYIPRVRSGQPTLEPSLRRSTLQQLALLMRQQGLHETFLQCDGLKLIVSLLRLSLMVDDYLLFPECAISCVSVLNSVCFISRHALTKMADLPLLLLRVILIFPANENSVLMSAQVLAIVVWAGFALQELDTSRRRIPALPLSVTERIKLPFLVNSYWKTSPNTDHSSVEWLLSDESFRSAIRVRWWWVWGGSKMKTASIKPSMLSTISSVPSPTPQDLATLTAASLQNVFPKLLLQLENATSHDQVNEVLILLESYINLLPLSGVSKLCDLPWLHTRRFLSAPPASARDVKLLMALLQFIVTYMDKVPKEDTMSWIISSFIGKDAVIISLLSKERLYPQQTPQEDIEVTQLRIHIVKVLVRCIVILDKEEYSCSRLESLLKILLSCLERIDLKDFHMLGYLNEVMRCVRYALHSRYCKLSEEVIMMSVKIVSGVLGGCASGGGRKGESCRLDALLTLLAMFGQIRDKAIPVQRWSEYYNSGVVSAIVRCISAERAEVRASALYMLSSLSHHTQIVPQLLQCIPNESLAQLAIEVFISDGEANVVLAAAAALLTAVSSRTSIHSQVIERDVLQAIQEGNFIEDCLNIFVDFVNDREYEHHIEPNIPLSVLDRGSELEVRAQKSEFHLSPTSVYKRPPPTASLVAAAADVINNVTLYKSAPVQLWNEKGLYRVLFRCLSQSIVSKSSFVLRSSVCRALAASSAHKCVRTGLANTKDCVYHLLLTITPLESGHDSDNLSALTQAVLLLASLLPERSTFEAVCELKDKSTLFTSLLQALESDNKEWKEAAMQCLSQLARSMVNMKNRKGKDKSINFLDELKSPYQDSSDVCRGDNGDCQPDYMVEDICKLLIDLFRKQIEDKKYLNGQDPHCILTVTCLCCTLRASPRARSYSVHRQLPRDLARVLSTVRDHLTLLGKPIDTIRNANHEPTLATLNLIFTLASSMMIDNPAAKDRISEDIATTLTRLWPWCMMTEELRNNVMKFLLIFTNECPRAWSSMVSCVGGRSIVGDVCVLVCREASRPRHTPILVTALSVLTNCVSHHHCRAVILKSDMLSIWCKLRGRYPPSLWLLYTRVCRHPDGAAMVLGSLHTKQAPTALLPALANAAHHCRHAFLQSPDLLELLSSCLLTGDTTEIVSSARAVWVLAANNHRAKLVLRSSGIPTAVQTTLQRLQKSKDVATRRAVELLTYTNTVLQAI